jgi:large subunit ribosomal protein L22
MPYSFQIGKEDEKKIARAFGKELNVSPKHANEICAAILGKMLGNALEYLKKVQEKKAFVPFRRYAKKVPHRKGGTRGRYPVKTAKMIVRILENAKANAEHKGLDTERLKIIHATAYKGLELQRLRPKGGGGHGFMHMGRFANIQLTDIEIILKEV